MQHWSNMVLSNFDKDLNRPKKQTQVSGYDDKDCKTCECCAVSLLIVRQLSLSELWKVHEREVSMYFFGQVITLIKYLKGHKSLGSIWSVVKTLTVSLVSGTKGWTLDKVTYWAVLESQKNSLHHTSMIFYLDKFSIPIWDHQNNNFGDFHESDKPTYTSVICLKKRKNIFHFPNSM